MIILITLDIVIVEAATQAVSSPLLEQTINGATGVLLNITGGDSLTLQEVHLAADVIYNTVNPNANIVFGSVVNDSMYDEIAITVIATGFDNSEIISDPSESSQTEIQNPSTNNESKKEPEDTHSVSFSNLTPQAITSSNEDSKTQYSESESNLLSPTSSSTSSSNEFDLDVPAFLRDIN